MNLNKHSLMFVFRPEKAEVGSEHDTHREVSNAKNNIP